MQHKFLLIIYLLIPFEIFSLEDENEIIEKLEKKNKPPS